ncbi:leader peptidase (prepilin peptidase)/N-methyltransferase [Saccharomonospora amisosensis]|uniref:Leader peptidase (Prepilin peptidase)/N-methyltransferase n=1 Tax=Saccharomonospora amisosensis TaxID=1128677 RepID=A0A7X5UMQ7_9PSEU|nr:A24 family peptidase [Saccharomonospora amisosensis]NIJ10499.1 leader peptidase (prepilin peptidase)/N-methyltransferase [Saccharomonospora amisosensis]
MWQTITQLALTTSLFPLLALRWDGQPELFVVSALTVTAVPLAVIDARTGKLPNWLMLTAYIGVASTAVVSTFVNQTPAMVVRALTGMLIILAFYGTLYALFPGQLGGGDVKLGGLLGFALCSAGWSTLLTGTLFGWGLAAVAQLILRAAGRLPRDTSLRVGPFLIAGAFVALLTGTIV